MKRMSAGLAVAVLFSLGLSPIFNPNRAIGQDKAAGSAKLPSGKWALTVTPAQQTQPVVDLYSVTTVASKGLAVTRFGVRNLSADDVAAVKVGWRLFTADRPEATLLQGETPLLGAALAPGEWRTVDYPVVTFVQAVRPFLKGENALTGNYKIEVAVTGVTTSAEAAKAASSLGGGASFVKVSSEPDHATAVKCQARLGQIGSSGWGRGVSFVKAAARTAPALQCQDQACMWGPNDCFICVGSPKFGCSTSGCDSCTNSRCENNLD